MFSSRLLPALLTLLVSATAVAAPPARGPLAPDKAKVFRAVRPDPPPKALAANSHFVVSDEKRHDLYRPAITGLGGVLTGVGTDQLYLMSGWARPEVLVPMDFDQVVVDLHLVYRVIFLLAKNPSEFMDLWTKARRDEVLAMLDRDYPDPALNKRVKRAYELSRGLVHAKLKRTIKMGKTQKVPTFLDDQEQYDAIVALFREDRVFPVRGDLTGTLALRDLAKAARETGIPIRVFYLSNAEYYFDYVDAFRESVAQIAFDERSVVLRTAALGEEWSADGHYHYQVQPGGNFQEWLKDPRVTNYRFITRARVKDKKLPGYSTVERVPAKKK
jgi:hypothetical protein